MVQVTYPHEEKPPSMERTDSQNITDEAGNSRLSSVNVEAYRGVTSTMMSNPINITNPGTALNLLEVALRHRNVPLAKQCIAYLSKNIQKDNALKILLSISKWLHASEAEQQLSNFEPSAPPLVDNDEDRHDNWMKEPLENLRQLCLSEIDKHGDAILKEREVIDLHYLDLLAITTRDTLSVSNEMVVYLAIIRWCMEECKRKALVPESADMKALLRELVFAPRYGLMSKRDFLTRTIDGFKGPDRVGILDENTTNKILECIKQKEKKKKDIEELPYKLSQERKSSHQKKDNNAFKEKAILNCLTCLSVVFD